ncbi:MAG: MotA/TolQ/ExbB proton channel family protein [Verrucomicrobia bacterium]|nr:MotA/TolQ/ExbB proton channel family protein [Verrucomicrobiota bacterium]MCF7707688.1 MotA/TolQ/ExbB proton channel family protein [Verrucomicrobiota bacterium]
MWELIISGDPFMLMLVATSVVGLAFIIDRGLALRWPHVIPTSVSKGAENSRFPEDADEIRRLCKAKPSSLSRILLAAMEKQTMPKAEASESLQTVARHEVMKLERGLVVLEIIVGIAPLLGLVGTIHGLITSFSNLSETGMGSSVEFARGIALALNATLMGLLIAIPSLIAWSYYNKKVEALALEMEALCDEFVRRLYRRRKKR